MSMTGEHPSQCENAEAKPDCGAASGSAYLVDCNAYGSEPLKYKTIAEALEDNRIVSVTKQSDGRFQSSRQMGYL